MQTKQKGNCKEKSRNTLYRDVTKVTLKLRHAEYCKVMLNTAEIPDTWKTKHDIYCDVLLQTETSSC